MGNGKVKCPLSSYRKHVNNRETLSSELKPQNTLLELGTLNYSLPTSASAYWKLVCSTILGLASNCS